MSTRESLLDDVCEAVRCSDAGNIDEHSHKLAQMKRLRIALRIEYAIFTNFRGMWGNLAIRNPGVERQAAIIRFLDDYWSDQRDAVQRYANDHQSDLYSPTNYYDRAARMTPADDGERDSTLTAAAIRTERAIRDLSNRAEVAMRVEDTLNQAGPIFEESSDFESSSDGDEDTMLARAIEMSMRIDISAERHARVEKSLSRGHLGYLRDQELDEVMRHNEGIIMRLKTYETLMTTMQRGVAVFNTKAAHVLKRLRLLLLSMVERQEVIHSYTVYSTPSDDVSAADNQLALEILHDYDRLLHAMRPAAQVLMHEAVGIHGQPHRMEEIAFQRCADALNIVRSEFGGTEAFSATDTRLHGLRDTPLYTISVYYESFMQVVELRSQKKCLLASFPEVETLQTVKDLLPGPTSPKSRKKSKKKKKKKNTATKVPKFPYLAGRERNTPTYDETKRLMVLRHQLHYLTEITATQPHTTAVNSFCALSDNMCDELNLSTFSIMVPDNLRRFTPILTFLTSEREKRRGQMIHFMEWARRKQHVPTPEGRHLNRITVSEASVLFCEQGIQVKGNQVIELANLLTLRTRRPGQHPIDMQSSPTGEFEFNLRPMLKYLMEKKNIVIRSAPKIMITSGDYKDFVDVIDLFEYICTDQIKTITDDEREVARDLKDVAAAEADIETAAAATAEAATAAEARRNAAATRLKQAQQTERIRLEEAVAEATQAAEKRARLTSMRDRKANTQRAAKAVADRAAAEAAQALAAASIAATRARRVTAFQAIGRGHLVRHRIHRKMFGSDSPLLPYAKQIMMLCTPTLKGSRATRTETEQSDWDYICLLKESISTPDAVGAIKALLPGEFEEHTFRGTLCGCKCILEAGEVDLIFTWDKKVVNLAILRDRYVNSFLETHRDARVYVKGIKEHLERLKQNTPR